MDDRVMPISTSKLLPEAHARGVAGDQSTRSPGGSARRASWERLLYLEMQRIPYQDPYHHNSEVKHRFYTLQVVVGHTRAESQWTKEQSVNKSLIWSRTQKEIIG